jgi:hypothetical protein
METRGGRQIGQQVFTNCGSMAAELLYQPGGLGVVSIAANETERGEKSRERLAALLVLRDEGWVGLNVLWEYKTTQLLQKLLQREDLVENTDDPLISRIVRKLSRSITVHEDLDIILKKPREQLLGDQYPESPIENFAVWIPGYAAIKVAGQLMKGHHVSNLEAAFAVVDGAVAAFGVGSIVAQAVKTTGKQAVKKSIQKVGQELAKDALEEAGKTIVSRIPGATVASLQTLAKNSTKLEVTHLARAAAATAKKVGIRSWGTLDRRIIMRGDRKVIVDLLRKEVRDEAGTQLIQETGFNALFAVGPLMLERVIPSLQVGN